MTLDPGLLILYVSMGFAAWSLWILGDKHDDQTYKVVGAVIAGITLLSVFQWSDKYTLLSLMEFAGGVGIAQWLANRK